MSARPLSRALAAAAILVSLSGCASAGAAGGSSSRHHDNSVITTEDMSGLHLTNLYEVVERLHPDWLAPRNAATFTTPPRGSQSGMTEVQVYLNSQRAGNADVLKEIPISGAASVRYLNAAESEVRFGSGNLNGVIQVITAGKG